MLNMLKKLKTSLFEKKIINKKLHLLIWTLEMQKQCQKLKGKKKRKKKP